MTNESGLCFSCEHEDYCLKHNTSPEVKVSECGRYEMNETYREISDAIHETAKMFRRTKDGEQECL